MRKERDYLFGFVAFLINIGIDFHNEFNRQFKGQKKALCKPFKDWYK
jgi:hypothetical protein